ncbi:MAG: hypothetical protein JW727_03720 [Candidatus Aenigmarchaeota archaeon]|nr:hypothetical protein [Candidatus Aenigmarchaeota archaeon]
MDDKSKQGKEYEMAIREWWGNTSPSKKAVYGIGGLAALGGLIVIGSIAGALMGAVSGEVLDHTPYLGEAVINGFEYLGNFVSPDYASQSAEALQGNLDKAGAAAGFLGGFLKSYGMAPQISLPQGSEKASSGS